MKEQLKQTKIKPRWKDQGALLTLAHPDDESLFWKMIHCLC